MKVRPSPPTLRSLTLTSGLSPTPNRCISDFAIAPSKFLPLLGTSVCPERYIQSWVGSLSVQRTEMFKMNLILTIKYAQ